MSVTALSLAWPCSVGQGEEAPTHRYPTPAATSAQVATESGYGQPTVYTRTLSAYWDALGFEKLTRSPETGSAVSGTFRLSSVSVTVAPAT